MVLLLFLLSFIFKDVALGDCLSVNMKEPSKGEVGYLNI